MSHKHFPTFSKLMDSLFASPRGLRSGLSIGPMWYVQPWYGEPIAAMQQSLLRMIAVAHQQHLPLTPLVLSLALEHRGRYRARLFRLARRLDSGLPLVAALEQTPDVLDDEDVLALRLASQSGTLPEMLEQLRQHHAENQQARQSGFNYSFGYWTVLGFMILIVLLFLSALIAPTFVKMAEEMGVDPPRSFTALQSSIGTPATILSMLLALGLIVTWLNFFRTPQRFLAQSVAPKLLRPVAQRRLIQLYRLMAMIIESGRPIPGAISTLARYHFDARLRRKLLVARNEIEQGEDVWQSLSQTGVLQPNEARALQESSSSRLRAWILKRLAWQHLSSAAARSAAWAAIVEPLIVLAFAGLVLWICSSYFMFLVLLIETNA